MFLRRDRQERKDEHKSLLDALRVSSIAKPEAMMESPDERLDPNEEEFLESLVVRHRPKASVDLSVRQIMSLRNVIFQRDAPFIFVTGEHSGVRSIPLEA